MTIQLPVLERFPKHRQLLERAVAYFQADQRVVAVALGGSIAVGNMDFYSDIDLDIVARDDDFDAVFAARDKAAVAVGQPLFRFIADHLPIGAHLYIVLYDGPIKLDFNYLSATDVKPSWTLAGRVILKDTNGFLAAVKSQSAELNTDQPPRERVLSLNQKFWTWCWYVFGKIKRGELWEALDGINSIRSLAILPMLDWVARKPEIGYRRLESKLDAKLAEKLAASVANLQPESLYAALQAEIALFKDLRDEVFARYNLEYDSVSEKVLRDMIVQQWGNSGG
jgi:predicted nucleotidyltransferase